MSGSKSLRRRMADRHLNRTLNALAASRKERVMARAMYSRLVTADPRVGFNAAEHQVVTALLKGRRERDASQPDTSAGQA